MLKKSLFSAKNTITFLTEKILRYISASLFCLNGDPTRPHNSLSKKPNEPGIVQNFREIIFFAATSFKTMKSILAKRHFSIFNKSYLEHTTSKHATIRVFGYRINEVSIAKISAL